MKNIIIAVVIMFVVSSVANAQVPVLVDPSTGRYLGNMNANQYDPNSVNNPYGRYGSKYSPESINNPYGRYGSQYSPNSVTNPYATSAPVVIYPGRW